MHTYTEQNLQINFNYNSDLSGKITIEDRDSCISISLKDLKDIYESYKKLLNMGVYITPEIKITRNNLTVTIPILTLENFLAFIIREKMFSMIEQAKLGDIIKNNINILEEMCND